MALLSAAVQLVRLLICYNYQEESSTRDTSNSAIRSNTNQIGNYLRSPFSAGLNFK